MANRCKVTGSTHPVSYLCIDWDGMDSHYKSCCKLKGEEIREQ